MTGIVEKPAIERELFKNQYLTGTAHAIMNLYVQNLTQKQIAERLGKDRQYISAVVNAPNFQHMLSIRRATIAQGIDETVINAEKEAADVLKAHAKETAEKMVRLLDSENEAIVLRAGADILDRVGPQKRQKGGASATAEVTVIGEEASKLIKETVQML
jgi:transcriptional regulator with XRE-family HTH domain